MKPRTTQVLCEGDEPDNFEDIDLEGGFTDDADDDMPEYDWDYFYEFDDEDE